MPTGAYHFDPASRLRSFARTQQVNIVFRRCRGKQTWGLPLWPQACQEQPHKGARGGGGERERERERERELHDAWFMFYAHTVLVHSRCPVMKIKYSVTPLMDHIFSCKSPAFISDHAWNQNHFYHHMQTGKVTAGTPLLNIIDTVRPPLSYCTFDNSSLFA